MFQATNYCNLLGNCSRAWLSGATAEVFHRKRSQEPDYCEITFSRNITYQKTIFGFRRSRQKTLSGAIRTAPPWMKNKQQVDVSGRLSSGSLFFPRQKYTWIERLLRWIKGHFEPNFSLSLHAIPLVVSLLWNKTRGASDRPWTQNRKQILSLSMQHWQCSNHGQAEINRRCCWRVVSGH